jgi:DNA-binding transcriptional ArsR family regulator
MADPRITWDIGTAYDFFISLHVLHVPNNFGLRAAWAAGMRSRLPASEREFLDDIQQSVLMGPPLGWLHHLPDPKDATVALEVLEETPVAQRLSDLTFKYEGKDKGDEDFMQGIAERGKFTDAEREATRSKWQVHWGKKQIPDKLINGVLGWWARSEEFGERIVPAMQAYYEVFFAEEERRIRPFLDSALERAQGMAAEMPFNKLVESLSQGVRIQPRSEANEFVLTPSYWSTPLMFFHGLPDKREILTFGARPDDASLVPGETVPDALVNGLKALADPTRLRILRYLTAEPLTPTQLARRLRLRAPTVIHHLQMLRAAGLVYVLLGEGKEKAYQSRAEGVMSVCGMLDDFMSMPDEGEG